MVSGVTAVAYFGVAFDMTNDVSLIEAIFTIMYPRTSIHIDMFSHDMTNE